MCKISREKKKERAILYMKELGLFKPCIKNFEKYDEVQMSEPWGGLYEFSDNEELNKAIKEFEEEYDSLVYHVIHAVVCGISVLAFAGIYVLLFERGEFKSLLKYGKAMLLKKKK